MTVKSGFFSDGSSYNQAEFNAFLVDSIGSGYVLGYENELGVSPNDPASMGVYVKTGRCYVQGYYGWVTANEALTVPTANATNPRIDRVVARLSVSVNQSVTFAVLTGTPAASPSAPALTRTSETYEISLARIAVGAGVTSIVAANITDERGDATVCGVSGVKHSWSYLNNVVIDVSGMTVDVGVSDRDPVYFNGTKWVVATRGAVGFYDEANDAVITAGYLDGFTGLTPGEIVGGRGVALTATEIVVLETPVDNSGIGLYTGNVAGYLLRSGVVSASSGVLIVPAGSSTGNTAVTIALNGYGTYCIKDNTQKCFYPTPCLIPVVMTNLITGHGVSPGTSYAKSYDSDGVLIDEVIFSHLITSGSLNIYDATYIVINGGIDSTVPNALLVSIAAAYIDAGGLPI